MKKYSIVFLFIISLSLSGCYEDYLNIFSNFSRGIYSNDSTKIYFFHELKAGQPPKGISRFPDGGTHKILFRNVAFYEFDILNQNLKEILNLKNLPSSLSSWQLNLTSCDDIIALSINPTSNWNWHKKHSVLYDYNEYEKDFAGIFLYSDNELQRIINFGYKPEISAAKNKIAFLSNDSIEYVLHMFDIVTKLTDTLAVFSSDNNYNIKYFWQNNDVLIFTTGKQVEKITIHSKKVLKLDSISFPAADLVGIADVKKTVSISPYKAFGLHLEKIWTKPRKELLDDIKYLNGNLEYRKAIIEQIQPSLNQKEKEQLIIEIDAFVNRKEGYEKMKLEMIAVDTKNLLK